MANDNDNTVTLRLNLIMVGLTIDNKVDSLMGKPCEVVKLPKHYNNIIIMNH